MKAIIAILVLRYYSTDQRTPITQSQMNYPLTVMLCLIILPLVIMYSTAAAASAADNGGKPRDKSLSSVITCYSSFHPLFVRDWISQTAGPLRLKSITWFIRSRVTFQKIIPRQFEFNRLSPLLLLQSFKAPFFPFIPRARHFVVLFWRCCTFRIKNKIITKMRSLSLMYSMHCVLNSLFTSLLTDNS